jgi:hypothetical protein
MLAELETGRTREITDKRSGKRVAVIWRKADGRYMLSSGSPEMLLGPDASQDQLVEQFKLRRG